MSSNGKCSLFFLSAYQHMPVQHDRARLNAGAPFFVASACNIYVCDAKIERFFMDFADESPETHFKWLRHLDMLLNRGYDLKR